MAVATQLLISSHCLSPPLPLYSICFHARFGFYYKARVPKFGRDLAYCPFSAELLVAASAPEVYRLNLAEGRFLTPLTCRSPAVNACGISPAHGLLACAGEDGGLECFDLRQRDSVGRLNASAAAGAPGQPLTALRFDNSGMHLAVGTGNGLVALFDLRSQVKICAA
jgi:ribosome biogenesis protein ENP2